MAIAKSSAQAGGGCRRGASGPRRYVLEDQVGFLLRCAHQRATEIFNAVMGRFAVTPTQFAALAKLDDLGSVSQNQLGRLTRMDPATVSGVVGRLIARGFVRQSPDAQRCASRAAGAHARRARGGAGDEGGGGGGLAPHAGAAEARRGRRAAARRWPRSGEPHVRAARHPAACRRAPAPVARADRRGAEGLGHGRGRSRRPTRRPAGASRRSCRSCATSSPAAHAHAGEPERRRARGAADGRGLPPLRRRVRDAHGGGGRRGGRRAAGAHDGRGAAGARLRQRRRRHRRAGGARPRARHRRRRRVLARRHAGPQRRLRLDATSGIGGIATSGARGRSFSLGIADSVDDAGARRRHRRRRRHARRQCGERRQPRHPPPPGPRRSTPTATCATCP